MKYSTATILSTAFWSLTLAASLEEREVPQEHSHEPILVKVGEMLKLDNPKKIQDPVFGLLGDGAAKQGAGEVTNLSCLQRSISDQAFTNAKKANDIDGMTNAVLYAALERNTGAVGKESDICNEPAVNPEIEAIERHQDPASKNAAETNKAIVLEAAKQIDSFGGDPQLAAKSATFAPGKIGDPTAAGNTCDDQNDKDGCIFTKKLIQVEATPEEIKAAVASVSKNKKRHNGIEDHLKREQSDSVPRNSFLNKRHAPKNSGKLISKRGLSSHLQSESQNLHKRDNDDRKNRQNRNNRNRGNRNKDNDDKKKRDIDGNDNDSDNGNGNDNDNDFDKRDDDDRKNRQNRNNRNRGNRNKDNDDKKKRDIDGNDNDSDNGNGNDNDNDFDKRDDDDRKNRQNRNNRNRGNRNKDNDDKKKRDIDGNDNDSDNGNGNDNDNDFDKRDDDDRKNRQNRNNRNRGNRNKDNDDKKKRDIDGNDNDSDNGNGNDNDNDFDKRDDDDRKNRQNRNNRNRGNRNKDNDDKKKRDIDGNDNDSDNGNGNDNDNDFDKRDDDDRKNRQNRNNRNRGNRNKDNDDKKKRDIDGNDNDSDNGNGNDNDNDFDKRDENIQTFEGKLGGLPPKVTENPNSDRPFTVNGDTFVGKSVALQRSCSIQHNACANAANSGSGSVSDCEKQEQECNEVAKSASKRSISSIVPRNIQRINRRRNATQLLKKRANNFGSCSKPEIQFKSGFDGRKEESFKATNQEDFNHGSTQNIKITSDFICERLKSTCEAPEETVNKCQAASTAAASLSGQEAADAFNNGVGA